MLLAGRSVQRFCQHAPGFCRFLLSHCLLRMNASGAAPLMVPSMPISLTAT